MIGGPAIEPARESSHDPNLERHPDIGRMGEARTSSPERVDEFVIQNQLTRLPRAHNASQKPTQVHNPQSLTVSVAVRARILNGCDRRCSSHCHERIRRTRKAHCPRTKHRDPVVAT
jgi:hypothetical protein